MKAKDYADKFFSAENKREALVEIARSFLAEIVTLSNARNAKFARALVPICKELNQKWVKFAGIVNKKYPVSEPVKYTGFKELVKTFSEETYLLWMSED